MSQSGWRLAGELLGRRPSRRRRPRHWGPGGDTTHLGPDGERVGYVDPAALRDSLEGGRPEWLPSNARLVGFTADTAGTVRVQARLWAMPDGTVVNDAGGEEFPNVAHFQFAVEQTHDVFSVWSPDELAVAAAPYWSGGDDEGGWSGEAGWDGGGGE